MRIRSVFCPRGDPPGYDLAYGAFPDFDCNQRLHKSKTRVSLFKEAISEQHSIGVSGGGADRELCRIVQLNFGNYRVMLAYLRRLSDCGG